MTKKCTDTAATLAPDKTDELAAFADAAQLEFDFTRTTPLQLTPAAARKEYAEYRCTVRDEPDRRSKTPQRRPPHGAR